MGVVKSPVYCYACKRYVDHYLFDPIREELTLFGWIGVGWNPWPGMACFVLGVRCEKCD